MESNCNYIAKQQRVIFLVKVPGMANCDKKPNMPCLSAARHWFPWPMHDTAERRPEQNIVKPRLTVPHHPHGIDVGDGPGIALGGNLGTIAFAPPLQLILANATCLGMAPGKSLRGCSAPPCSLLRSITPPFSRAAVF